MGSPFPGMDPYLEAHWLDIHTKLVAYAADALNSVLPEDLIARAEERAGIGEDYREVRRLFADDPATPRWVEIRELRLEKLVTIIEFLRPSSEMGKGLAARLNRRSSLPGSAVNLVEIDLTRGAVFNVTSGPNAAYLVPMGIRKPLPVLPIALRRSETPVDLPLQPLIEQAYRNGRYAQTVDYSKAPVPPLDEEDAQWADALLHSAGKR